MMMMVLWWLMVDGMMMLMLIYWSVAVGCWVEVGSHCQSSGTSSLWEVVELKENVLKIKSAHCNENGALKKKSWCIEKKFNFLTGVNYIHLSK